MLDIIRFHIHFRQNPTNFFPVQHYILLQEVLVRFEENYGMYEKELDLSYMLEEYNSYLVNVDKQVKVLDPKGEFEGIARGINASGELLIETPDGKVAEVYAGEVSVRGMYGYV